MQQLESYRFIASSFRRRDYEAMSLLKTRNLTKARFMLILFDSFSLYTMNIIFLTFYIIKLYLSSSSIQLFSNLLLIQYNTYNIQQLLPGILGKPIEKFELVNVRRYSRLVYCRLIAKLICFSVQLCAIIHVSCIEPTITALDGK